MGLPVVLVAESVLGSWIEAVNGGDVNSAVELYSPSAVLLPTFCSGSKVGPKAIREYFDELNAKGKVLVDLDQECFSAHLHPGGIATMTGFYTWTFACDQIPVLARFTFTLDTNRSDPILHHHSSLVPDCIG